MKYAQLKYPTAESFRPLFEKFFQEHGHYPSGSEINASSDFPSVRFFDRNHGGLTGVRNALGLPVIDNRKSDERREVAQVCYERAYQDNDKIYVYLRSIFGDTYTHSRDFIPGTKRSVCDFYVFSPKGNFFVEVLSPSSKPSFQNCLNLKLKKYPTQSESSEPVIFLQMNTELSSTLVASLVANKKNKLPDNFKVMCVDEFKSYCNQHA